MQAQSGAGLPPVDEISAQHSARVARHLREHIAASGGSISFAEYMQHALYAPGLGYYVSGSAKFGPDGDFITAPEVSPLFASVLARQCGELLLQLDDADVLELGAGSGILAAGLLQGLARRDSLPRRYCILEVSADLVDRQQRLLLERVPEFAGRVEWLSGLPDDFRGVIVANEVADALPVERFTIEQGDVLQYRVASAGNRFTWQAAEAPAMLNDAVREIETDIGTRLADGYTSEVSLSLGGWIRDIAACLAHGAVFLFDYGVSRRDYYAAERSKGWLRCHFRHRVHDDPLILAGIQDLTSWVDFTVAAGAAADAGMAVDGFVTQGHFLMNGGMREELTDFTDLPEKQQIQLSRELKLLTLPGEMGENFKCLGLSRGKLQKAPALVVSDRAHML